MIQAGNVVTFKNKYKCPANCAKYRHTCNYKSQTRGRQKI